MPLHVEVSAGRQMDNFFSDVQKPKRQALSTPEKAEDGPKKALPKGVVLGKDGKPYAYLHF